MLFCYKIIISSMKTNQMRKANNISLTFFKKEKQFKRTIVKNSIFLVSALFVWHFIQLRLEIPSDFFRPFAIGMKEVEIKRRVGA